VARLQALVRSWVGIEFFWDLQLVLQRAEVPRLRLGGRGGAMGHTTWLGSYRRPGDAGDLCFDVERSRRPRVVPDVRPAPADLSSSPPHAVPAPA